MTQPGFRRSTIGLLLAAVVIAAQPMRPARAADPSWFTDWTVLVPDFELAIAGCAAAAAQSAGAAGPVRIYRLAPQNHGYGLVELETAGGDTLACSADLGSGAINFVEPDTGEDRNDRSAMLFVMPAKGGHSTCPKPRSLDGPGWTGWLVRTAC